ncbi:unnamed protein product [Vicia faba]|uniref:Uncharacterized protein n=1 Tax=Vicia faba TaxID=3906 RepID=A0AAV0ZGG4_VICFA|nr:unnamed protein product [Vicia faba]
MSKRHAGLTENISGLQVFHLFSDSYQATLSLPQSIQSLKNIALYFLGVISILGNLQSLETLDLDKCKINELLDGLAKLSNLRLLNLRSYEIMRNNPFEVIEGCSSLEELSLIQCLMLISLFQVTTARSLVSLAIVCCSHLEYIIIDER